MKKTVIVAACSLVFGMSGICQATPIPYQASGVAFDNGGNQLSFSGSALIDDLLRPWGNSTERGPDRLGINEYGIAPYGYRIVMANLQLDGISLRGDGDLYLELALNYDNEHSLGDTMWFLEGRGGLENWKMTGEELWYRNEDGTLWEPEQYINLPPLIELRQRDYGGIDFLPTYDPHFQLLLTRQGKGPAPVPEPATMILTGVGLACAGLSNQRREKKK